MGVGPKTIFMIKVENVLGTQWFYYGCSDRHEAYAKAEEQGFDTQTVTVKQIPNKFGIQFYEWRQAAP